MIESITGERAAATRRGRHIARALTATLLAFLGSHASAAPFLLDWDSQTWLPEGNTNLSESLPVGNHNVVVTITGNTAELDQDDGGGTSPIAPSINSQNTGGLTPVEDGLHIATDYTSNTNPQVTITLDFSQYPGGVSNISFTMFDVDASGSFIDRAVVTAFDGVSTLNPTGRVTSVDNQLFGSAGIEGTSSAGGTTADGNATFSFSQTGITQLTIVYSNQIGTSNPGFQFVNIHDFGFDAPVADVGIVKTASTLTPTVGANLTFTLTATNNGPDTAPAVAITDVLPAGYTYVSDDGGGAYINGTGVWTVGSLANTASATLNVVATVNGAGPYANTASVTGVGVDDTNAANDSSTVTPVPIAQADLSLTKTVTPIDPLVGGNVTFTLTVNNSGPAPATGIVVTDSLPGGLSFVSDTPSQGSYVAGSGVWTVGTLNNGANATLDIVATVLATGSYANTAQVSAANEGDPDSTPGNNLPAEDDQDAVTVTPAQIGLAKRLAAGPTANGDGSFRVTYEIRLENTGDATLNNVQATDSLATTFTGATGFAVQSLTSADFAVNGVYNGSGNLNLLAGTDSLSAGASGTITLAVDVTPGANLGPYNNTANGQGTSPGGSVAMDASTDGANVDPDGNGDPGNNSTPTEVSFAEAPQIGAAKAVGVPVNNGDGTYAITYTVRVENTGDVALNNVQATDSLATTFSGATFAVAPPTSADFAVNGGFNGVGDVNLLAGTDTLAAGASGTIVVTLTVTPGANLGPYNNAVNAIGTSPAGTGVNDLSTDGADVDPDGNGDPGNNAIPTPVSFAEAPQIGAAKAITAGPTSNGDGTYDLTYTIVVENTGDVALAALQVDEDLATTFAGASFSLDSITSADFTLNAGYNGIGATGLLAATDTLAAGASGTVVVAVTVTPGANLGPYDNTATASGNAPSGTGVSDASTDGANVDPDGNGDPGNNATPTPVTFAEAPEIGAAKAVSVPLNNGDGTYDLSYTIVVENTGDVSLSALQVSDNLAASFAGATFTVGALASADFAVNGGFDGSGDTDLLAGTDTLAAGASGTIVVPLIVTPGANLGPYDNTATASGTSPANTGVNDDSTDGADVDPDGNGDPGNNSTPTPVTFAETPEIGVAKAITAGPASNGDGSFTLTYSLRVENTGDVPLAGVQVTDDLATAYAAATAFSVSNIASGDFSVNVGFNGDADQNLLGGGSALAVGAAGTVTFDVTVTPGATLGPYNNTATGSGTSPSGTGVNDASTDGANVDPDGNGDPGDNSVPTPATFVEMPQIGVAKAITSAPVNDGLGNFTFEYTIIVDNTGDVALENLQVVDNLAAVFAGATSFTANSVTSGDFATNGGYNGGADTDLLAGTDTLAPGTMGTIVVNVTVTPGANLGPYDNTATGSGTSPGGTPVNDVSQSGANVDPDGNGDPGNNSDPTPISFNEAPQIGAAKALSAGPASNGDGTFTLTYTVTVENTGDVALSSVQVIDNFDVTFATATAYGVDSTASTDFTVNALFDGSADTNLLAGSDSLALGASGTLDVTVTVTPGGNLGPYTNAATASGTSPAGTPVTDLSTDGTDVDPDGNGDPGNNAVPTPVTFVEAPEIGIAKAVAGVPINNNDGSYTFSYTVLVENTGDVDLNNLQVTDNLGATFAPATAFVVDGTSSADFALDNAFNGVANQDLLLGTGSLAAGASGTVTVTVTVTPGGNLGPYTNTANASGTSPGGTPVNDVSTDGADVDPNGDGNPGNDSAPTPITFVENAHIGVAKRVSAGPTPNGDGTATLTYTFVIENTGDVPLQNVQLADDLTATFGAVPFTVNGFSSTDFTFNALYNGDSQPNILSGSNGLGVGVSGTLSVEVTVTPGATLGPFDNSATASALSPAAAAVSDVSTDGANVDPDGNGDPGNNSAPTPVTFTEMPSIGIAKTVSSAPVGNGDGSFSLTYTLTIENTGDVALQSVQVTDSLATTYAGAAGFSVDAVASAGLAVNGGFDGDANTNVLSGLDTLAIGASETVDITVTVTPAANLGPYDNSASASGQSPAGAPASDDSVNGTVPDFDGNGDPTDDASPTPVTFVETPQIGLAKSVSSAPANNGDGTFTLSYTLTVDNTGDVPLSALQVVDDLTTTFAGATSFSVDATASTDFTLNAGFVGSGDTTLLTGVDTLAPGATGTIDITVTVTPGANLGPYANTAIASGLSPAGGPVSDVSQSGANVDPDGDGDPGNNNDPTPVSFNEAPQLGVAKRISGAPTSNGDGSFSLTYTIFVENTGDVTLTALQVVENFDVTFAGAAGYTVDAINSADFAVNAGFDGSTDTNLLAGTDTLGVTASGLIDVSVTLTPGANLGPYDNTATATGDSPAGTPVSDDSTDGATPDPDGDGNPGNNADPTPLSIVESPQVGVAKAISSPPTSNGDGTFTLTYNVLVQNTGDVTLSGVQVTDSLTTTFAGATSVTLDAVTSPDFATNPAYDGDANVDLLTGADTLAPTANGNVLITVTVEPNGNLGPYNNTATGSGTSPGGTPVSDDSQNGANVDPDGNGDPGDNNAPTPTLFSESPAIGTAKYVGATPTANGDGSFTVSYTIRVENIGDVALNSVQVSDVLGTTFAGATGFSVVSVSSPDFATNAAYDGTGDTDLLAGSDALAVAASGDVIVTASVTPGMNLGPYANTATATGMSPGGAGVSDDSTDGTNVDPNGDGDAGDNNTPTPVTFVEMPQLGLAKSLSVGPIENGDGTFDITYNLTVVNTGDVEVLSLQVIDDLAGTFAAAVGFTVNAVTSADFVVSPSFDGAANANLLAGTDTLAPAMSGTVQVALTVDPGGNLGPYDNSATATGTSVGGMGVSDVSQSGTAVDPDGNGDPGDNSDPTPVSFNENPQLGAAKAVTAGPTTNPDGTFTLTYTVTVVNSGDVALSVLQIDENLNDTFPGVASIAVDSVTSTDFAPNTNFNGVSDTNLLGGADIVNPGTTSSAELTVTVTPSGNLGPFNNTATVSGVTPNGTPVSDDSTEGTDPDPEGDGPADNDLPTAVTFTEAPGLGVALRLVGPPVNNGDGTFTVEYEIVVQNTGDIALANLQVVDSLATTFAPTDGFTLASVTSADFTLNPNYDGDTDTNLLAGSDTITAGGSGDISVIVTVTPGTALGPHDNSATASATSPGGVNVTDISQDGASADPDGDGNPGNNSVPTPVTFPGSLAALQGNAWLDADIDDNFDAGEAPLDGWIVQVSQAGTVVGTANVQADGSYTLTDLAPGGDYSLALLNPANNAVFGTLSNITLPPGTTVIDQNLPIDPSGVVYDSDTRDPIAGATVSLTTTAGTVLPDACLLPDQQSQVTGVDGAYRFDVNLGADAACPSGATFAIALVSPTGYLDAPSTVIPAQTGPFDPTGQPNPFPVAAQPGAPQGGDSTVYYLSFVLATGDPNVINNHIPLDPPSGNVDVRLIKNAERRQGVVGDLVPYSITAENVGVLPVTNLTIRDNIPAGFSFVAGSARLSGAGTLAVDGQRPVNFNGIDIPVGGQATVRYILRVGAGVTQGEYVNSATPLVAGVVVGNTATARVAITADPDMEQTTIVGKVFNDINGDGYQDPSEPGIPGVRLATVEGLLVETDAYGRYHLEGVDAGFMERGRNFIVKVDPATLPAGAQFTTENPRVMRITQGLMNRFDFGVRLPGETTTRYERIAVKLGEVFFTPGSTDVRPEFEPLLDQLADRLRQHGGGRLIFEGNDACDADARPASGGMHTTANYTLTPRFGVRKAQLQAADRAELERIAGEWAGASDVRVMATGHTSSVRIAPQNRHEYANNYVLSHARADSVARYLQQTMGLADEQIAVDGRGPDEPVASNATVEGRAQNRRVELQVSGTRGGPAAGAPSRGTCDKNLARERAQKVFELLQRRLGDCKVCDIEMFIGELRVPTHVGGPQSHLEPNGEKNK